MSQPTTPTSSKASTVVLGRASGAANVVLRTERATPKDNGDGRTASVRRTSSANSLPHEAGQVGSETPVCPMSSLLETLARPWTFHILWVLSSQGPTRFGALRRGVHGISSRVLTERLRGLQEVGFVYREYRPTIPPEVTYGITKRMKDIEKVLKQLDALARKWKMEDAPR